MTAAAAVGFDAFKDKPGKDMKTWEEVRFFNVLIGPPILGFSTGGKFHFILFNVLCLVESGVHL